MSWILFAAAGLGVYKLARAIAMEEGPFSIFLRIRDRAGQGSWVGRGLQCPSCLSFWLGLAAALLIPVSNPGEFVLAWLGIAGLATLIWRVVG